MDSFEGFWAALYRYKFLSNQSTVLIKITIYKLHKITGNEPSTISANSHLYIGISSCGPVDKL